MAVIGLTLLLLKSVKNLKTKQLKILLAAIILGLGLLTRFAYFGHPKQAVLDEVYFGKFVNAYFTHEYFFDIHPPLGKLLIAGFAAPLGYQPTSNFDSIGAEYADNNYQILRFLPTLAGAILPLIIFLLALQLGLSPITAFLAGLMTVFDNGLATQSRFILIDSFLLLFGFASLACYIKSQAKGGNMYWMLGAAMLAGAAVSIKWTGLTFLALIIGYEIYSLKKGTIKYQPTLRLAALFVLPIIIYFTTFTIHFSLLNKSGSGDDFMSANFQKSLDGNRHQTADGLGTINILGKFHELNYQMYASNQRITADHPYASKWHSWPFMIRPMAYWTGAQNASIYFFGNPILWWGTTIAVAAAVLLYIAKRKWRAKKFFGFLLIGYFANLLPFIVIGRVMFIYHYMTALVFAMLITAYIIDQLDNKWPVAIAVGSLTVISFIFFMPFTYGLPLSTTTLPWRIWLPSWR